MDFGMIVIGLCLVYTLFSGKPTTIDLIREYLQAKIDEARKGG